MLNALNTAATGMGAQTKQLEVVSNNIANADTTGFKKSRADFEDLLYHNEKDPGSATSATTRSPTGVQIGAGVKVSGTTREHAVGSLKPTGGELDLALDGDGFFAIQKPNGEIAYTRDGSFQRGPEGRMETHGGMPIVPEISIPADSLGVQISMDGRVMSRSANGTTQEIGQIQITNFANPAGLQATGGNLYQPSPSSGEPVVASAGDQGIGRIQQRFLEASNVSPVQEMTDMIRGQRVYEMNSKVVSTVNDMLGTLSQMK